MKQKENVRCDKVSFLNEKYANEHIAKIKKESKRKVIPTRAYECNKCPNWHLTSQPNWRESIKTMEGQVTKLKGQVQSLERRNSALRVGDLGKMAERDDRQKKTIQKKIAEIKQLKRTNQDLIINLAKANSKNL